MDTESMTTQPSDTDLRVSWVYQLSKEELMDVLQKYGLNDAGTVVEQRRRLVKFLREGRTADPPLTIETFLTPIGTAPLPATGTVLPPTGTTMMMTQATPSPQSTLGEPAPKVHRWGLRFNGRNDPVEFLERLEEIILAEKISGDRVLPYMPQLLDGEAAMWFRNNRTTWNNWTQFVETFKIFYFPVRYQEDLEVEISRRLQRPAEPVMTYLTELQALMRRHGALSEERQLSWLYRNLLPEFRLHIRRSDFDSITTLSRAAREFEILKRETETTRRYRPQPMTSTVANSSPREPPHINGPNLTERIPENQRNVRKTTEPRQSPQNNTSIVCWRCGEQGHFRTECTKPPKLFCSRCGKNGVMSRNCSCSGNSTGACITRGVRGPPLQ